MRKSSSSDAEKRTLLCLLLIVCIDSILVGIDLVLLRALSIVFRTTRRPRRHASIPAVVIARLFTFVGDDRCRLIPQTVHRVGETLPLLADRRESDITGDVAMSRRTVDR